MNSTIKLARGFQTLDRATCFLLGMVIYIYDNSRPAIQGGDAFAYR